MKIHHSAGEFVGFDSTCRVSISEFLHDPAWFWGQFLITSALIGLIWTVQIVIYPQMGAMSEAGFTSWHRSYTRRMGWLVGPLMGGELALAVIWLMVDSSRLLAWLGFSLIGVNWLSTIFIQIPIHLSLAEKWRGKSVQKLVFSNWIRTMAWSLRGVVLLVALPF